MPDPSTHLRESSSVAVWKFPIPQGLNPAPVTIRMPARSEILHAGQQDDVPTVWALVNVHETEKEDRRILVLPTGMVTTDRLAYIGTTTLHENFIVAHVFEVMA